MTEDPRSWYRTCRPRAATLLATAFAVVTATGAAPPPEADLAKAAEAWLRKVRPLILPEEEAFFRSLEQAEDRKEMGPIEATAIGVSRTWSCPLATALPAPGRYLVKLEAADTLAGALTSQEASFEIVP